MMVISLPQRVNSPMLSPILSEWNTRLLMETTPETKIQIQLKPFRSKPFYRFDNIQPPRAYMSGLRETSHISQSMKARQNDPRKTVSKNVGPSNDVLEELFKKLDLAFRKFLVVFDPLTSDSKSLGLMKVTFG
ncbi:hypothetical protein H5410_052052 [Solanum commersonii]|uniref:Uncharacterized protein n=1 Tax=Solanum commersonii TaxID=4109 RepID=A0A9J5WZT4_SOLCO|nr:hypothetical protein H5410_052052 [Solanum commersonii]